MAEPTFEWKTCENKDGDGCDIPAHVSYVWPGRGRALACLIHATAIQNVANAMGLPLQFEKYEGPSRTALDISARPAVS